LYYDYSFCNDVNPYRKELEFLDSIVPREFNVISAKSCPLTFSLSNNRIANLYFELEKYFYIFAAFTEQKQDFIDSLQAFVPFKKDLLEFSSTNYNEKNLWNIATSFYLANYFSAAVDSSDGPWPDDLDFKSFRKHLVKLSLTNNRLNLFFDKRPDNDLINVIEFPQTEEIPEGTIIITNKNYPQHNLLFEDKLKIYGV
tara:strand:+ start:254 stop:850 length:597 start_codon:yes stop_codon:yes gene_type:complete